MKSTQLVCVIGIVFSLVSLTFGQAQISTNADQTTDTLHFQKVWEPTESVFALSKFYLDAERRTDLSKAIPELITALEQKGYHLKPIIGKKSYHVRTDIQSGACIEEYHLASEDGMLTLDVIVYPDHKTAFDNYKRQVEGGPSYGSDGRFRVVQLLLPKRFDKKAELTAQVFAGGVVFNLDWILPINVTWELIKFELYPNGQDAPQWLLDSLPGKKWHLTASDYQKILYEIKPKIDSFYEMAYVAFEHLVVPEDRVWMPKPGETSLSTSERIAGFIYLWSEVKYNFANFDLVPNLNWDRMRNRYLPLVEKAQTDEEYYKLLKKLLAELHDGHTSLLWSDGTRPPILIKSIEGKAVITDIAENDELAKSGLKRGMEITHVDGRPVKEIIELDRYPYISASTPQSRDASAYMSLLTGPKDSKVIISVRDISGNIQEVSLIRPGNAKGSFLRSSPSFEYRALPGDIAYITLNSFAEKDVIEQFDKIFDEKILKAKGLIIDVRENQGGSTDIGYAIISRLIDKPLKGSKTKTRQYLPTMRAWDREPYRWHDLGDCEVTPRGENPYLGLVIVLTGPSTFSAGEDFLVPLKASKRATLVGERTGGSTGQPLIIDVGGGVEARICTKRDTYPDGSDFVGIGVIPDVEVHPTQKDIADGKDRILEEGLAVTKKVIAQNQEK
jgi:C-terminal processing protease CtpA/Prc